MPPAAPSPGKPADYCHALVTRRYRLTTDLVSLAGKTLLDFGCGNGAQTVQFAAAGCNIIAVDVNPDHLQTLVNYLRRNNISTILPVGYDGARLPLADGSIDVVSSYDVLEHVPDERAALAELGRVLRPGGEIVISVPNKCWLFETHGAKLPLLPWNRVPFFSWLPRFIHSRFARARIYTKRDIVRLLQRTSFDVLSARYITAPLDVVTIRWLKRLLQLIIFRGDTTRIPFLATSVLVHGVKRKAAA